MTEKVYAKCPKCGRRVHSLWKDSNLCSVCFVNRFWDDDVSDIVQGEERKRKKVKKEKKDVR